MEPTKSKLLSILQLILSQRCSSPNYCELLPDLFCCALSDVSMHRQVTSTYFVSVVACTHAVKIAVAAVGLLGCDAFLKAQQAACVCTAVGNGKRNNTNYEF